MKKGVIIYHSNIQKLYKKRWIDKSGSKTFSRQREYAKIM